MTTPSTALLREGLRLAMSSCQVPESLHGGLERYILDRILPGGFLQAVLANDLVLAAERADPVCRAHLADLAVFLQWFVPPQAWGSAERLRAWTTAPPDRLELPHFDCPLCGRTSYNLNDVREGYCGHCHVFTRDGGNADAATAQWMQYVVSPTDVRERDVADEGLQQPEAEQQHDDHPDDDLNRR